VRIVHTYISMLLSALTFPEVEAIWQRFLGDEEALREAFSEHLIAPMVAIVASRYEPHFTNAIVAETKQAEYVRWIKDYVVSSNFTKLGEIAGANFHPYDVLVIAAIDRYDKIRRSREPWPEPSSSSTLLSDYLAA